MSVVVRVDLLQPGVHSSHLHGADPSVRKEETWRIKSLRLRTTGCIITAVSASLSGCTLWGIWCKKLWKQKPELLFTVCVRVCAHDTCLSGLVSSSLPHWAVSLATQNTHIQHCEVAAAELRPSRGPWGQRALSVWWHVPHSYEAEPTSLLTITILEHTSEFPWFPCRNLELMQFCLRPVRKC